MSLKKGFFQLLCRVFPWLKDIKLEEDFPVLSTLFLDKRFKIQDFLKIIEEDIGLSFYEGEELFLDKSLIYLIPKDIASSYGIIPLRREKDKIVVGVPLNTTSKILRAVEELIGSKIKPVYLPVKPIKDAISKYYEETEIMETILTVSDERRGIIPIKLEALTTSSSSEDWLRAIIAEAVKKRARNIDFISVEEEAEVWINGEKGIEKIASIQESIYELILKKIAFYSNLHYRELSTPFSKRIKVLIKSKIFYLNIVNFPFVNSSILSLEIWDPSFLSKGFLETAESFEREFSSLEELIRNKKGVVFLILGESPLEKLFLYELLLFLRREFKLRKVISIEREIFSYVPFIHQYYYESDFLPLVKILNKALEVQPEIAFVEVNNKKDLNSVLVYSSRAFLIVKPPFEKLLELQNFLKEANLLSAVKAGVIKGVFIVRAFKSVCPNCNEKVEITDEFKGVGLEGGFKINKGCYLCSGEMRSSVFLVDFIPANKEDPEQILKAKSQLSRIALEKVKSEIIEMESFIDYFLKNQETLLE